MQYKTDKILLLKNRLKFYFLFAFMLITEILSDVGVEILFFIDPNLIRLFIVTLLLLLTLEFLFRSREVEFNEDHLILWRGLGFVKFRKNKIFYESIKYVNFGIGDVQGNQIFNLGLQYKDESKRPAITRSVDIDMSYFTNQQSLINKLLEKAQTTIKHNLRSIQEFEVEKLLKSLKSSV